MRRQRVMVWTGGQPHTADGCERQAEALPVLPVPLQLRRAALIEYQWGEQRFQILASACSVRTTPWGAEHVTWLHCKAIQTMNVQPEETASLIAVLIPARYVTAIGPGPTFRMARGRRCIDLGVFPPNQPTPAAALPLAEVERVVTELLSPERN